MKLVKFLAVAATSLLAFGCASTNSKPVVINAPIQVLRVDWQGAPTGRPIPSWVDEVVDGNSASVAKALNIDTKTNKVFVVSARGKNLEFLKTWTDNVEVVSEVTQTLSRVVSNDIRANSKGSEEDLKRDVDTGLKVCNLIHVSGLEKKNQYWIKTRTAKIPGAKAEKDFDDPIFTYYVVYSMDLASYNDAVAKAMDEAYNKGVITDQASNLKSIMLAALAKDMCPEAIASDTNSY